MATKPQRNKTAWLENAKEATRRIMNGLNWTVEWYENGELISHHHEKLHVITKNGALRTPNMFLDVGHFLFVKYFTKGKKSFSAVIRFSPYDILEV